MDTLTEACKDMGMSSMRDGNIMKLVPRSRGKDKGHAHPWESPGPNEGAVRALVCDGA